MKATCPNNPKHKEFITTAHVTQEWKVDEHGNFIEEIRTLETDAEPDPDNNWTCAICGAMADVTEGVENVDSMTLSKCHDFLVQAGTRMFPDPDPWSMTRDDLIDTGYAGVGLDTRKDYDFLDDSELRASVIEAIDNGDLEGLEDWRLAVRSLVNRR